MRNQIFQQIKQNRRTYYYELKDLNKIKSENYIVPEYVQTEDKSPSYFHNKQRYIIDLSKQLFNSNINIKIPKINPGFSFKISKRLKPNKSIKFIETINQSVNKRIDSVIEQFYRIGSRIFEDNNETYYSQLEVVPATSSSNNIFDSKTVSTIQNETAAFFSRQFKIGQSLKKIQKNVLIYLEADTFTFNKVKKSRAPIESKEIEYMPNNGDLPSAEFTVNEPEAPKMKNELHSKIPTPLYQKIKSFLKITQLTKMWRYSNLHLKHLFPELNRLFNKYKDTMSSKNSYRTDQL